MLVLYGHALMMFIVDHPAGSPVFEQAKLVCAISVPVFFMVSGMVFRVKSTRALTTTTIMLILLTVVLHIVAWVIHMAFGVEGMTWKTLIMPLIKNTGHVFPVVWFFASLAVIQLLYHALVKGGSILKGLVIAIVLGGFIYNLTTGRNDWQAGVLLPGMACFLFGAWLALHLPQIKNQAVALALAVLALGTAIILSPLNLGCPFSVSDRCPLLWNNGQFVVWFPDGLMGNVSLFYVTAALGCLGVFWLSDLIARWDGPVTAWLSQLGTRTLDLIIFNGFVLAFVQPYLARFAPEQTPLYIAVPIAVALIGVQLALLPFALKATRPFVKSLYETASWITRYPLAKLLWKLAKPYLRPNPAHSSQGMR